jgi:GT2 family glycosyltransferase
MSESPRVSICIPAYARPTELREAIESVLEQSFSDVEVVVGDDSGELEPVVDQIADSRLRYFRNPQRLGMAGNWTAVLDRARGSLVGLLMDDDRLLPGYLESVVDRFDRDPSLGVVFTDIYFSDGKRLRRRRCDLPPGRYENFLLPLLEHNKPVVPSAALMRAEVWQAVRPLPDLQTADVVMQIRAALADWPFFYVDQPLMSYRLHEGQLSSLQGFRDEVVGLWELFEFDDPKAERLRRRYLAQVLVARGAMHLRLRRPDAARADITRAAELDPGSVGLRGRAVGFLASHPRLAPPTLGLLSHLRLISRGA